MNFSKILSSFIFLLVLTCVPAQAQSTAEQDPDWSVLMQDVDANPAEIRSLFESQWEGRERVKGSGYKQVERWLHLTDGRVDENDHMIGSSATLDAHRDIQQWRQEGRSMNGNWQVCGPTLDDITTRDDIRGVGRMNAIAFHPNDPAIIFAGAPAGGLWRSFDSGSTWETNTDDFPTLGVSAIAFSPSNPEVVYIGTGDRDASDSPGMGVMKSIDGGVSWTFVNSAISGFVVGALVVYPNDENQVIAATSSGIYKTTDGGETWNQVSSNSQNYKDIAVHPTNPDIIYCTGQGRFWRSEDAGETWEYINDGIVPSTRMVIAVSPAAPENVYVLSTGTYEYRAFYKSEDTGLNFVEMSDSPNIMGWSASGEGEGGQAWYDLCLEADPNVVDRVYAGGIRMKRSDDAGATWIDIQDSYLHVDQHALEVNPHTEEIWLANDGGIYRLEDSNQWQDMSHGIITGEIYKIGQSPFYGNGAMNGYQDNGTYLFNGVQWQRGSGGDGFECIFDPTDPDWFFSSSQYGRIYRTGPGIQSQTIVANGELGIDEGGAWSTPFTVAPENPSTMFVGLLNVWRSTNVKHADRDSIVWEKISSELGGTDANTMRVVHRHRNNENILLATEATRKLFRCDNALADVDSVAWWDLSENLPLSAQPVLAIETVAGEDSTVYISFNYKVWKSENLGESWTELEGDLPELPINTLVYDTTGTGGLYAGSDMGVYYWSNADSLWMDFSNGLPLTVRVTELELYPGSSENDPQRLRAGTYGRGMWESDVYGEPVGFPAIAYLDPTNGETSIYGNANVQLTFRRNLLPIAMEGFDVGDIAVTNATLTNLIENEGGYEVTVVPESFGPIQLSIPDAVATEAGGFELPNLGSDTLQLVYHPVPDAFGPWGPGGVGSQNDLSIWLRADQGLYDEMGEEIGFGESVYEWRDVLSGNFVSAYQEDGNARPLSTIDGLNGHPALKFDGENDCIVAPVVEMRRDISAFSVVRGAETAWNDHGWIASARDRNGFILHPWKNQSSFQSVVIDDEENYAQATPLWIVDASLPQFYGVIYDQSDWDQNFYTIVNDTRLPFPGSNIGARDESDFVEVRYGWDYEERFGQGFISEHFIYGRRLFESHRTIISNYIAARYGINLGNVQHYFRSSYPSDVAGIGMESEWDAHVDAQGTGQIRMSSPQGLENGEYLFWGHDGGALAVVEAYPFQSPRLERIWACEEVGDAGPVTFRVVDAGVAELFASSAIGLIVAEGDHFDISNQPDFYPLQNQGQYWSVEVDLPEHGVFTIGFDPVMKVEESLIDGGLLLYPNPANDYFRLESKFVDLNGAFCRALDVSGREVHSWNWSQGKSETVDVSDWPVGLYVVEISKNNQRLSLPFLKH
ncbi:MAG: T9SS type A sorting domain-containing protein [Flavobacteriales bacterium]